MYLLKRFADAGQLGRALFVCDRDELRSQAAGAFQALFGTNAAVVSAGKPQKNARVLVATYHTLDVDTEEADANFLVTTTRKTTSATSSSTSVIALPGASGRRSFCATPRQCRSG